eukprot:TRINITY_DN57739_c0_g1_i1.p1 TRINITY_DN57739_c0_g1~~TRINITY_DN57739_c0_g1_i1.p1  ORF type:complete len:213 (-),score=40.16 TRINITY_DN57739_c0_g1_i1:299-937(-)
MSEGGRPRRGSVQEAAEKFGGVKKNVGPVAAHTPANYDDILVRAARATSFDPASQQKYMKAMRDEDCDHSNELDVAQLQRVLDVCGHPLPYLQLRKLVGDRTVFSFKDVLLLIQEKSVAKGSLPGASASAAATKRHANGALADRLSAFEQGTESASGAPSLEELKARHAVPSLDDLRAKKEEQARRESEVAERRRRTESFRSRFAKFDQAAE